jgi:altronate dehydratase
VRALRRHLGIAANPTAGAAADRLIDAGGTAVFGETVEWLGAGVSSQGARARVR